MHVTQARLQLWCFDAALSTLWLLCRVFTYTSPDTTLSCARSSSATCHVVQALRGPLEKDKPQPPWSLSHRRRREWQPKLPAALPLALRAAAFVALAECFSAACKGQALALLELDAPVARLETVLCSAVDLQELGAAVLALCAQRPALLHVLVSSSVSCHFDGAAPQHTWRRPATHRMSYRVRDDIKAFMESTRQQATFKGFKGIPEARSQAAEVCSEKLSTGTNHYVSASRDVQASAHGVARDAQLDVQKMDGAFRNAAKQYAADVARFQWVTRGAAKLLQGDGRAASAPCPSKLATNLRRLPHERISALLQQHLGQPAPAAVQHLQELLACFGPSSRGRAAAQAGDTAQAGPASSAQARGDTPAAAEPSCGQQGQAAQQGGGDVIDLCNTQKMEIEPHL